MRQRSCRLLANGAGRRGWKVVKTGVESLQAINDARSVSFLDLDEDVRDHVA